MGKKKLAFPTKLGPFVNGRMPLVRLRCGARNGCFTAAAAELKVTQPQ